MKNTETKTNVVEDGTYQIIGEALGLKPGTIKLIRLGYRSDIHHVKEAIALVRDHQQMSRAALIKKIKTLQLKIQISLEHGEKYPVDIRIN